MSDLEEQIAEQMGDDETVEAPAEDDLSTPPSDEPQPEPEPEPEDAIHEPEQPASDVYWESRFKKAESAFKTYSNRISVIWEDDAVNLVPFGLSPSAPPGFIDPRDAGHIDDVTKRTVLEFVGIASEVSYKEDGDVRQCPRCEGLGKTSTGSRVPGKETRQCPSCLGYGFAPPPGATSNGAQGPEVLLAPVTDDFASFPADELDAWQEPRILPDGRENPNFGKMPQFKILVEPWGTTAGLTAQDVAA